MSFAERDIRRLRHAVEASLSPRERGFLSVHIAGAARPETFGFTHEAGLADYPDAIIAADPSADTLRALHARLPQGGVLFAVTDAGLEPPDGGEHWVVEADRIEEARRLLVIRYE